MMTSFVSLYALFDSIIHYYADLNKANGKDLLDQGQTDYRYGAYIIML